MFLPLHLPLTEITVFIYLQIHGRSHQKYKVSGAQDLVYSLLFSVPRTVSDT